jgi:hypothetical protein
VEDAAVSKAADSNKQALSPWVLLAVAQCFVLALGAIIFVQLRSINRRLRATPETA